MHQSSGVKGLRLTFSNACDRLILVAIRLLQSEENIDFGPVREHLTDHRCLIAILLSELSKVALVVKGAGCGVVRLGVTVGPATTSASEATSSTACRAPTASSGGPRCDLRHVVVFVMVVGTDYEEGGEAVSCPLWESDKLGGGRGTVVQNQP
jgi:hypothetical protein